MTLPNEEVFELLRDHFVLGARNIEKDEHVGLSHGYKCTQSAVGTTNGAGARNVQLLMLAADGTVLHALPGYWHPDDLRRELKFALRLHLLNDRQDLSAAQKSKMLATMHRAFLRNLPAETLARSRWQGFDEQAERMRLADGKRDTFVYEYGDKTTIKPTVQVVHERLMSRPFQKLADFDMESFVDYGRAFYDNNRGDKGRDFKKAELANKKRVKEQEKAARAEARS